MPATYQPPSQHLIDALAAAIIVFVTDLAQALFAPHPAHHMHRAIRRAERAVEVMLLLMAFRLATPPAQRLNTFARRNTPNGFTRRVRQSKFLFKHARVRLRQGAFHQRLARLIATIAQPTRYVQRFLKRLHKGLRGSSLVATHPPAHARCADAPLSASYANSS